MPRCEEDGNHGGTQLEKEGATSGYIYSGQQVAGWGWGRGLLSGEVSAKARSFPTKGFLVSGKICRVGPGRKVG